MTDLMQPQWGELVPFYGDDWKNLPDVNWPYYAEGAEGKFQHNRTVLGRALLPTTKTPSALKPVGSKDGYFHFDAPPLPKELIAQTVHFFRRVYDAHHTEACVLYTQNIKTGERRIFVPHQSLSHGGVHSIYNPTHIAPGHLVIGTAHSHCNFDGYHSGTDERDARRMDGLHITIGHLKDEMPDVAAMVSFQKELFHYKDIATVADFSDLDAAEAPEWWDRYLIFDTVTDADRQRIAPYASNEDWDRFMGRWQEPQPKAIVQHIAQGQITGFRATPPASYGGGTDWHEVNRETMRGFGYVYNEATRTYHPAGMLRESVEFNERQARQAQYRPPQWNPDGSLQMDAFDGDDERKGVAGMTDEELEQWLAKWDATEDYWEDALGKDFVDSLFNSGVFNEDDLDSAIKDAPASLTPQYWEARMRMKLFKVVSWLRAHNHEVKVQIKDTSNRPLPGQIEAFPADQKGA